MILKKLVMFCIISSLLVVVSCCSKYTQENNNMTIITTESYEEETLEHLTFKTLIELSAKRGSLDIKDFERLIDLEFNQNGCFEKRIPLEDDSDMYVFYLYAVKNDSVPELEHAIVYKRKSETSLNCSCTGLFYDIRFGNLDHLEDKPLELSDFSSINLPKNCYSSEYMTFIGVSGGFIISDQEITVESVGESYTGISYEEQVPDHVVGGFEIARAKEHMRFNKETLLNEFTEGDIQTKVYVIEKMNGEKYYLATKNKSNGIAQYMLYINTSAISEEAFQEMINNWTLQGAELY